MKRICFALILFFIVGLVCAFPGTSKKELSENHARSLIKKRIFTCKGIRFSGKDKTGSFTNDVNTIEAGKVYLTSKGIIHKGKSFFLIPWKEIKSIARDKMAGSSSTILIRTLFPKERLRLIDPKGTGSMDTLDTAMDTLLRRLKQTLGDFKKNPAKFAATEKELKAPNAPLSPPPAEPSVSAMSPPLAPPRTPKPVIKRKSPPSTKVIKKGMSSKEIERILGPPLKKVILDDKVIYKYEDMVLTFINGKMTDTVVK
ncbi:MAG: hypothetical protein GY757_36190 [bacterium]|nr:hypothetical protein [bacterium]